MFWISLVRGVSTEYCSLKVMICKNPYEQSPASINHTNMATVFGQFFTHDITLTMHKDVSTSSCIECFSAGTECYGIPVNVTDYEFIESNIHCIPMKRATRCQRGSDEEQINIATSYIDASHIYGNNDGELRRVRGNPPEPNGQLLTAHFSDANLKPLLPPTLPKVFCRSQRGTNPCFYSGDFRRNNVSPGNNIGRQALKHKRRL